VNNQQQAHTLKYSYDEYGRRQTLTLPDSTTLKYSYNQFGQLSDINLLQTNSKEVELAQPLVTLSYDSQSNIKTQQFGNSITLNQQFDVFNRLTQQQLTHPAQALFDTCTYNYDSVNQLIARKNEGVSSQNINFEYNSLGQLIQQTLASSRADTTTHYQWDSFGNPQSQTVKSNTSDADLRDTAEQGIKHDAASNEHTASSSIDLTHATHSVYNELAPNSNESSSKNSSNADSVINNEGTYNTTINSATDADRLTQFGDSDFYYDEFGNQIRETGKGIKTRREYNAFNQLSCFNNNGTLTQYDYDPLGRRIAKHTEHGKIDYIWDNDQLIGECQHGEYTWYINLPNQFHPVALIKQGEVYYYHLDQLHTPRFVTNNKAEVVWENQADVYGYEELKAESNKEDSFTQPIRFQGQYLDEESGLHYNRYRYYSPKQQRFINQDPIGLVGGINHYQYAPNPVNWVDPMGLLCKEGQAKVKAALDANSAISPELKEKLIAISKFEDTPFTADEMVEKIEANLVNSIIEDVRVIPTREASITDILHDVDEWSLSPVSEEQKGCIKSNLKIIQQRDKVQNEEARKSGFSKKQQRELIKQWEVNNGLSWPNGATPHHVIPLKNGGTNEWWNLIPVKHPHTGTIHGTGSALRSELPYSIKPGTITELK